MNKILLSTIILMVYSSCSSTKNIAEVWVGKTKQNLITNWGTPVRTFESSQKGEILVFADQVYINSNDLNGDRIAGPSNWNYRYIYVDNKGKIVSYKNEKQKFPPQQLDYQKILSMNVVTVK